jgi:outer membrane lipopolysaccharide assembly protein LptE/RlpB
MSLLSSIYTVNDLCIFNYFNPSNMIFKSVLKMAAALSFILCLNACGSNATTSTSNDSHATTSSTTSDSKTEITSAINAFYTNGVKVTDAYSKDSPLLSAKLKALMTEVSNITEADAKRIKSSASPTDKGLVFEGPLFNGSEGGVAVTVLNVTTKENTAIADVEFEYTNDVKTKSKERVALVNENGWKIDNVFFHESQDDKNTQALLQNFVQSAK